MKVERWLRRARKKEQEQNNNEDKEMVTKPELSQFTELFRNFNKSRAGKIAKRLIRATRSRILVYHHGHRTRDLCGYSDPRHSYILWFSKDGFEVDRFGDYGTKYVSDQSPTEIVTELVYCLFDNRFNPKTNPTQTEVLQKVCEEILETLTKDLDGRTEYK